ncbi:hypothetical protein FACS189465_3060 [Clostridia bacterium]|nr:hypothetical protein FACS189465_3060 [Clostridia bacterium]
MELLQALKIRRSVRKFTTAPISWKGTLQQYAGRLHRTYDGKKSVIIYDYVDVHIKMLETMYHKRVSGYSGMGYKTLNDGGIDDKIGVIFDSRSFLPIFEQDVKFAKHEIVICSPFLRKVRTTQMMRLLSLAQINGVRVTIITRPADSYKLVEQPGIKVLIQLLLDSSINVITRPNIHQKFVVIDQNIVWYGSINLLSYGIAEESIMRFENIEIAEALLAVVDSG